MYGKYKSEEVELVMDEDHSWLCRNELKVLRSVEQSYFSAAKGEVPSSMYNKQRAQIWCHVCLFTAWKYVWPLPSCVFEHSPTELKININWNLAETSEHTLSHQTRRRQKRSVRGCGRRRRVRAPTATGRRRRGRTRVLLCPIGDHAAFGTFIVHSLSVKSCNHDSLSQDFGSMSPNLNPKKAKWNRLKMPD